jgi:hypothetical protein
VKAGGESGTEVKTSFTSNSGAACYVAVHAEGLAPSYRTVVHPPGSAQTRVRQRLDKGNELVGFTLVKSTGEPLSLAEFLLTPPTFGSGTQGGLDAPAEGTYSPIQVSSPTRETSRTTSQITQALGSLRTWTEPACASTKALL